MISVTVAGLKHFSGGTWRVTMKNSAEKWYYDLQQTMRCYRANTWIM